jgi:hypothetical protein
MGLPEDYGHVPPNFARTLRDTDVERDVEYLQQQRNEAALNYDGGKLRYDLIPADALDELAKVYTAGAEKYADRNWEAGMSWSRAFGSLMRHAWAWMRGEDIDSESGLPHMAHAAFRCLQLLAYAKRGVGGDDRPGGGER